MRLKSLTVHGFKSFADKTSFDFETQLTGIVGPNGCGKSNVVDALKWVLGDQRVRSLRGKEMTDVIFKGAEGRDGSHQAEVTITLIHEGAADDAGGLAERTEVTIGRRLTKDKESDYILNGDRVRLKDVRDVLMDTGLGVGAYSVMEQGRIDAVLSANPEDRRAIFEEAAGISRFKLQKRESLRKLDRTEINLARVKDLLEERARRIRSLKIQAGKARRYRELRTELRDLRTAVAVVNARELRTRLRDQGARLAELTEELEQTEHRCAELEEVRDQLDHAIESASRDHESLQDALRSVQSRIEGAHHQAEAHDQRAADQSGHAADSRRRQAELQAQHNVKSADLETARQKKAQLGADLLAIAEDLDTKRAAVEASQALVNELQGRLETAHQEVLEWMHERTRARNAAHDVRVQLESAEARCTGLDQRTAELDGELTAIEAQVCRTEEDLHRSARQLGHLTAEERMALAELEIADAEAAELARRESELRQGLSSVTGRLQILTDMETHMEGLDQGPRFLLERQPPGLQGRLLDLLETDLEYSAALEAALGPYVQGLVVETREHADAMHELLRREGKGRAILLVEREIPDDLLVERPLYEVPPSAASLSEHVRFPGYSRCLVHWLLRGVCLVESLDAALSERHDLCFVTRDGSLLCGPRIEGGSAEGQGGLVVRKATMQVLTVEAEQLKQQLDELLDGKQVVADRVAALEAEVRRIGDLLQEVRARTLGNETHHTNLLERVVGGERDLADLALQITDLDGQRATARARLMSLLMNAFCMGRQEADAAAREAAIAIDVTTAQGAAAVAVREVQEVQLRQVACRSESEAARHACEIHEATLRDFVQNTEDLARREQQSVDDAAAHAAKAVESRAEADAISGELEALRERRDTAATALSTARSEFTECKEELSERQRRKSEISDGVTEDRLALGEIEHRFEWLEDRLFEDVGIALRRCLGEIEGMGLVVDEIHGPVPGPDEPQVEMLFGPTIPASMLADELALNCLWEDDAFDADACAKDVKVLQARIERLGSVNLDAVAELDEEESDFVLTEREVKDLTESRTALIEALRKMETESRVLFEETFSKARENFQVIFRKLFQGGRADMFLTEEEDSLEGGIEIMARPPGKQLQSINLLSGGERTLTALAILFAVFKVKPSPFCILDEVDAALDDTNVERFLRVLDDFIGPTQFCVVTHHKRTMAACDTLYGVTMQRRGVSSRIAVNLEQVDELTETGLAPTSGVNGGGAERKRIAGEEALGF